jgi:ArsR family transcriptional regulator
MSGIQDPPTKLQSLSEWLRVLADPKRLLILDLLMQGFQCNCELSALLQLAPNLTSHHMSVLHQAGLVNAQRDVGDARWIYYSINENALEELVASFGLFFNPARVQPRRANCGPQVSFALEADVATADR